LFLCPICGLDMGIWLILPFLWGSVLELGKGFVEVVGHQWVGFLSIVVPLDGKATILFAIPIAQTFVELLHGVQLVLCILFPHVFYPNIVNN
jgi:hypothetical protein